ncbi:protein shisa-3-like [Ptychodera flava]|uniref:protein shisa-3-like n=1 Tax=Ptychodera flava TaxID=63121 RepID=UPI00396A564A
MIKFDMDVTFLQRLSLTILVLHKGVKGTEYCEPYYDNNGNLNNGFTCSNAILLRFFNYCCGICTFKYCCNDPSDLDQSSCQITTAVQSTEITVTEKSSLREDELFTIVAVTTGTSGFLLVAAVVGCLLCYWLSTRSSTPSKMPWVPPNRVSPVQTSHQHSESQQDPASRPTNGDLMSVEELVPPPSPPPYSPQLSFSNAGLV